MIAKNATERDRLTPRIPLIPTDVSFEFKGLIIISGLYELRIFFTCTNGINKKIFLNKINKQLSWANLYPILPELY